MKRIKWELMRPQDIEIRPAQIKDGKATLLLFQDSRNTMDALDRNFGEFGWKIEYKDVAGQIYGRLSILNEDTGEWVAKEDTGDESNISAQKGQSSDILKRCAVRFGYGRELYSAPRIVIDDDGYGCKGYRVQYIEYNEEREIIRLLIVNRWGKPVFDWVDDRYSQKPVEEPAVIQPSPKPTTATNPAIEALRAFCRAKIKEEPEWKKDIEKFGIRCAEGIEKKGWRTGKNSFNEWYAKWVQNRKVA